VTTDFAIDLEPIFKRIPQLRELDSNHFKISKLAGYTNDNFRLQSGNEDWVLRIPKPKTDQYINRQFEANNVYIAEMLELAPVSAWRDPGGLSLTGTLVKTRSVCPDDFAKTTVFDQLVDIVRCLHDSKQPFLGTVDLTDLLTRYYRLMPVHYQELISGLYQRARGKIIKFSLGSEDLLPSHNDLVLENILIDDADRIWIIDWEYSSMASPYWDLATVCNSFELDHEQSRDLLDSYLEQATAKELEMLMEYRYVLQVLSICWLAAFTDSDIVSKIQCLYRDPEFEPGPGSWVNGAEL
jgi:thiamine kinase-like enzyme